MNFYNVISSSYTPVSESPRILQPFLLASYDPANSESYPGSGTVLYDLTNNNNITLYGGMETGWDSNGWFQMDGGNDYGQSINIPINWTSNTNGYTVGMWMSWDNNAVVDFAFHFGNSTANGMEIYSVNEQRRFRWFMNGNYIGYWNNAPANTFAYLVMTYKPTSGTQAEMRAYYGIGGSTMTQLFNQTGVQSFPDKPSSFFRLSHPSYELEGKIGESHIYEKALSIEEINQNYNQTKARYGY